MTARVVWITDQKDRSLERIIARTVSGGRNSAPMTHRDKHRYHHLGTPTICSATLMPFWIKRDAKIFDASLTSGRWPAGIPPANGSVTASRPCVCPWDATELAEAQRRDAPRARAPALDGRRLLASGRCTCAAFPVPSGTSGLARRLTVAGEAAASDGPKGRVSFFSFLTAFPLSIPKGNRQTTFCRRR